MVLALHLLVPSRFPSQSCLGLHGSVLVTPLAHPFVLFLKMYLFLLERERRRERENTHRGRGQKERLFKQIPH